MSSSAVRNRYHSAPEPSDSYFWPPRPLLSDPAWSPSADGLAMTRQMPEPLADVRADSRWPAFFPSPISLVTTTHGHRTGFEKVVGASIVNRFPYVIALSFCREHLSERHHVRATFTELLEASGTVAVQFLPPGSDLNRAMEVINTVPDLQTHTRLSATGLRHRPGTTNCAPVLEKSFLVYEARLVRPGRDFSGDRIFDSPWADVGSHRVYFLEVTAIQLRADIADGRTQISWKSLPVWQPESESNVSPALLDRLGTDQRYVKPYTPHYRFPASSTTIFERDAEAHGMAIKHLPPLPEEQVEVDNDRARWPCFFPSSVGMITSWDAPGVPNLMPCGSTTVVSRHPLVVTPCVSYAAINSRYAPRKSLASIRDTGRFGCGVPYVSEDIVAAIRYAGNVSLADDRSKLANAGLEVIHEDWAPVLSAMPIHFDCKVVGEVRLGTHIMFLGEVTRIRVRRDVTPSNPLQWRPWADLAPLAS